MILIQRVKIWAFRILTKRILTCLFKKKKGGGGARGLFSILVQNRLNSPKVTKKVLVFQKVARSCSLTKKVAQNPKSCWKVTEQNLDIGLTSGSFQLPCQLLVPFTVAYLLCFLVLVMFTTFFTSFPCLNYLPGLPTDPLFLFSSAQPSTLRLILIHFFIF